MVTGKKNLGQVHAHDTDEECRFNFPDKIALANADVSL
jgi:hypothetical protein